MSDAVSQLVGKTLTKIDTSLDEIYFYTSDGTSYKMFHDQSCCESVFLDEIVGDLSDLLNSTILQAEMSASEANPKENHDDSWEWTFYRLATAKGQVVLRWYGESNGYYSVNVNFEKL